MEQEKKDASKLESPVIEMIVKDGVLKVSDLPAVMAEFRKPFPKEAEQFSDGNKTGKQYDTAGYGYAWISERLNDVVGFCWRMVESEAISQVTQTKSGNNMYSLGVNVVLQLGNWINKEIEDIETIVVPNTGGPAESITKVKKTFRIERIFQVLAETPVGNGWHKALALTDAQKGAKTNGFKKAAGFWGLGNDAYKKIIDPENEPATKSRSTSQTRPSAAAPNPVKSGADLKKLYDLLAKKGVNTEEEGLIYMKEHHSFEAKSLRNLSDKQIKMCLALLLQSNQNQNATQSEESQEN